MERISKTQKSLPNLLSHPTTALSTDVVIVSALRTPLTRAKKGHLNLTKPEILLAHVFKSTLTRTKIDPSLIEDIAVGNVLLPGSGAVLARAAMLLSGMPIKTPIFTLNRQCSSGLEAVGIIAAKIRSGLIECGIGAGVESMSLTDMQSLIDPEKLSDELLEDELASNCLLPMGMTSEILAKKYNLKRSDLD